MTNTISKWALWVALFGAVSTLPISADAQSYPTRPVHVVVGLSPGSTSDVVMRIIADKLQAKWGQGVIVDNRPGAGGSVAADFVARSNPDGYTILLSTLSIAVAPSFYRKLTYDPLKDLIAVTELTVTSHVLCVNPALPIKSVSDLISMAKAKPLMYSSAGLGQSDQMATLLFQKLAGIQMTFVPYKGGPPALQAVMAGEVALDFPGVVAALPFMKTGQIRCLAVTTNKRSVAAPDLPTLDEAGVKGYEHSLWNGIFVPSGTPPAIVAKLSADFADVLRRPDIVKRLAELGIEPVGSNPEEFKHFFEAEVARWAEVIKAAGFSAN